MPKPTFFDFKVRATDLTQYDLSRHKGKVALVVNVASKCGFTSQYKGLEELYRTLPKDKFVVLGFPCNQFGEQEPGTEADIQRFCSTNYSVSFPIVAKINVNGEDSDPVYQFLKSEAPGILNTEKIKWNFTKFLVGKDGHVIKRYAPNTLPMDIKADIETAIAAG